ncbi:hypothetical protein T484DRAFT_1933528 [Baffinella frigidus]|nr:hypothetical protein T484DRAFT_1933528 [Cryptophyta sp. CCMP2293]
MPMFRRIDISAKSLNADCLIPRKDYDSDVLTQGALQVARGCVLLMDETEMEDGKLEGVGLEGLNACRYVMTWQALPVDYVYFSHEMELDSPIIVASPGTSSFLDKGIDVDLALDMVTSPSADVEPVASFLQDVEGMKLCRAYIAYARSLEWDLPDHVSEHMSDEWVSAREADRSAGDNKLEADLLQTWLSLCRVISVSHGETEATEERWAEMRALEKQRFERIPSRSRDGGQDEEEEWGGEDGMRG